MKKNFNSMNMHLSSLSDSKDSDTFQKVKYPLDKKLYSSSPKSNIESKAGKESLEILSLGAGVQSSTLLLMSLYGVLPKLDYVIFADTGWEPTAVYLHLEKLEKECEKYKVPLIRVKYKENSDISTDPFREDDHSRTSAMPMFVTKEDGGTGMIQRRCTGTYKVQPINKMLKVLMKKTGIDTVNQWIGISYDELHRMKKNPSKKVNNFYPLVDLKIDRGDCKEWLKSNEWSVVKSSCIGCPYHSNRTWQWLKDTYPDDFDQAVQFDKDIRWQNENKKVLNGTIYLHRKLQPLDEIDFRPKGSKKTPQTDNDFHYGFGNECEGLCGV